jgi:hypothetical protein
VRPFILLLLRPFSHVDEELRSKRRRILCNLPARCNYTNIKSYPLNFDPTALENGLDLLQKNARTAIKFFIGILPSFSDETEHSRSLCRRPPTGRDPLMHGSASAMAGPASTLDGGLMPDVVSPNVAAPAGTQMVAAPDGLLMTAGVSPNTTAPTPSPLQMAAALDALQMAAAPDELSISKSFLVDS